VISNRYTTHEARTDLFAGRVLKSLAALDRYYRSAPESTLTIKMPRNARRVLAIHRLRTHSFVAGDRQYAIATLLAIPPVRSDATLGPSSRAEWHARPRQFGSITAIWLLAGCPSADEELNQP